MLEVLSVHVPKSAGQTIRSHLVGFYGRDDVLLDYGGAPRSARLEESYSPVYWSTPQHKRCIHGFINLRKYELLEPKFTITCLREPVERLLSHYWYWMHLKGAENPMVAEVQSGALSLLDLARHSAISGLYTQHLFNGVDMNMFDLVGSTDKLPEFLSRLGEMIGTSFEPRFINLSPEPNYKERVAETRSDTRLMAEIRSLLRHEIRFFEAHAGRGPLSLAAPLPAFRERAAHRAEIMQRHPTAHDLWPPRHRPDETNVTEAEAEACFLERHSQEKTFKEIFETPEMPNTSGISIRDHLVEEEAERIVGAGLPPEARVVDIGAGTLRLARTIAPHLAPNHYFATEANPRLIEYGWKKVVANSALAARIDARNVILDSTFDFSWSKHPLDLAIASFVFDRLPLAALDACLANLAPVMQPGGRFYMSYIPLPAGAEFDSTLTYVDGSVSWPDRAPFHHRIEDIAALAERRGWTLEHSSQLGEVATSQYHLACLRYGEGAAPAKVPLAPAVNKARAENWWQSPEIWRHINAILGEPDSVRVSAGFHSLIARTAKAPLARGLSIDCRTGFHEHRLMLSGAVEQMELWDPSEDLVRAGKAEAERFGLGVRAHWRCGNGFAQFEGGPYDLIYWNNTIHMQPDVEKALEWSVERLAPGGLLAMDGYVGPSRFQYSDVALDAVNSFRATLPRRFLRMKDGRSAPARPERVPLEIMIADNPTQAPDCGRLLDLVGNLLPGAQVVATGGVIYQLGLSDILWNVDEVQDSWVLASGLLLDRVLRDMGHTHFASIVWRKPAAGRTRRSKDAPTGSRAARNAKTSPPRSRKTKPA